MDITSGFESHISLIAPLPHLTPWTGHDKLKKMKDAYPTASISLESFNLPLMEINLNKEEQVIDNDEVFALMEGTIPSIAHSLGALEDEVENWTTTWITQDHYFVIPFEEDDYDWGLFRISWDDNRSR